MKVSHLYWLLGGFKVRACEGRGSNSMPTVRRRRFNAYRCDGVDSMNEATERAVGGGTETRASIDVA